MAGNTVRKRNYQGRTRVKTGCATCRIRRVKCDENKPYCKKCSDTGRTCDGYTSPFRIITSQSTNNARACNIDSSASLQFIRPTLTEISPQDIDHLNRCFSIKTIFDVKLQCDQEARQILRAGLTDAPVQHAVSSLRLLRDDFERRRNNPASIAQQSPSNDYGLQQYCKALVGLASNLSTPGSIQLRSALLCCQLFISIEQARENYAAMAQHITQGLKITHEYRVRPVLVSAGILVPACREQLPLLDVFIIKLFAAPCKFAEPPATADGMGGTSVSMCSTLPYQRSVEHRNLRTITPDIRKGLSAIATSTLEFLDKVSHVESRGSALRLLSDKASLLGSLESWFLDLELIYPDARNLNSEPYSVSFMRFFHHILKVILVGALNSSPDLTAKLRIGNEQLQNVAITVGERVKAYRMDIRAKGGGVE